MSTKERYGTAVWEALCKESKTLANVYREWASVGQVAEAAGVSRATARKYLDMLVENMDAEVMIAGNHRFYSVSNLSQITYQE